MSLKNSSNFMKFIFVVIGVVLLYIPIFSIVTYAYKSSLPKTPLQIFQENGQPNSGTKEVLNINESKDNLKRNTNILVIGMDNASKQTDVLLACNFDEITQEISLISIPRDTYVSYSDDTQKKIDDYVGVGNNKTKKINGIYNLTGGESIDYTVDAVEDLLHINFDYYVLIDLEAFKQIVDDVGGVEMTLTRNYYYHEIVEGWVIDLKAGTQILYGKEAEQLIRYRNDYTGGDVQRIEVQQDFMKAFFSQVLQKKTVLKNAPALFKSFLTYVETDFKITDAPYYLEFLPQLNGENFKFYTLPGESMNLERSYFIYDEKETAALIDKVFYSTISDEKDDLNIKIFSNIKDTNPAIEKRDRMYLDGYNNIIVNKKEGNIEDYTKVLIKDESINTTHLEKYFEQCVVEVSDKIDAEFDVYIILGKNE